MIRNADSVRQYQIAEGTINIHRFYDKRKTATDILREEIQWQQVVSNEVNSLTRAQNDDILEMRLKGPNVEGEVS